MIRYAEKNMITLGDEVKDSVTGFIGIAVARVEWLHGCIRIVVQPEGLNKDGKPFENQSFDEPQLKTTKQGKVKLGAVKTGGPMPVPHARQHVQ
jgi:hypothetical protein